MLKKNLSFSVFRFLLELINLNSFIIFSHNLNFKNITNIFPKYTTRNNVKFYSTFVCRISSDIPNIPVRRLFVTLYFPLLLMQHQLCDSLLNHIHPFKASCISKIVTFQFYRQRDRNINFPFIQNEWPLPDEFSQGTLSVKIIFASCVTICISKRLLYRFFVNCHLFSAKTSFFASIRMRTNVEEF